MRPRTVLTQRDRLIAEKITIPVPKVYAYQLGDDLDPLSSYVILEYVDGRPLSATEVDRLSTDERARLYTSLADTYIQLRRLTFPSIGCLTWGPSGVNVLKQTATIDLNMQDLEGLRLSEIQDRYGQGGVLSSATEYTAMLLNLADNALSNTRSRILDQEQGDDVLYHHHPFHRFVNEDWLDKRLDHGPTKFLALGYPYLRYLERFDKFLNILKQLEDQKYGNQLLSHEWEHQKSSGGFLVANALENWTDIDRFSTRHINRVWFKGVKDAPKRIKTFIGEDPTRRILVDRLCRANEMYKELQQLDDLDGASDPGDAATTPNPFPRRLFFDSFESSVPGGITTTLALGSLVVAITLGVWKKYNL
ncbi:hypothetical protein QQZ08_011362 [Neonectria magnoliae]|uniref:Aminoglycoside phosphotransferase domain-containing protein n=1 Tax=Neonectria magnoliae TaxID=2732573 RepID=A0ABR1HAP2_9HYPO